MFPRLRQQLLARVDLLVELSTLGEYGVDERGRPMALDPEPASRLIPRSRDLCGDVAWTQTCETGSVRARADRSPAPACR